MRRLLWFVAEQLYWCSCSEWMPFRGAVRRAWLALAMHLIATEQRR